jgi:hypothetical protein
MLIRLSWSIAHPIAGGFEHGICRAPVWGMAGLIGAQVGAQLSQPVAGTIISRPMAVDSW